MSGNWDIEAVIHTNESTSSGDRQIVTDKQIAQRRENMTFSDRTCDDLLGLHSDVTFSNPSESSCNVSNTGSLSESVIHKPRLPHYKKVSGIDRILPQFTGHNMPINQFVKECKKAERFVNPIDKEFFIEMVNAKITGEARSYLQYNDFSDLDQIFDELKETYAPTQSLAQVQTDLARVIQGSNEKVAVYGLRVKGILGKALELINEDPDTSVVQGMKKGMMSTAIQCFILGLDKEVSQRMIGEKPKNLEKAISLAADSERYVKQREELRGEYKTQIPIKASPVRVINNNENQGSINFSKPEIKCYRCGLPGHIVRECEQKRERSNRNKRDETFCNYCKKIRAYL